MVLYHRQMDSCFSAKKSLDLSNFHQKYGKNIYAFMYMFFFELGISQFLLCRLFGGKERVCIETLYAEPASWSVLAAALEMYET